MYIKNKVLYEQHFSKKYFLFLKDFNFIYYQNKKFYITNVHATLKIIIIQIKYL